MKILILDIETAPNIGHVWQLWKQNIGLSQLMSSSYMLCFAAKWVGEKKVYFASTHKNGATGMRKLAHMLLSEADVVVHYNGTSFDIPTLNKEFLLEKLLPPSSYKQIDLYRAVKKKFRFPSYKLAYVSKVLGLGSKVSHEGHELWVKCMDGQVAALKRMEEYNIGDVNLTERLYKRLLPWIPSHPNKQLYDGDHGGGKCPSCGGNGNRRGEYASLTAVYQRFQCRKCGSWFRARKSMLTSDTTSLV